MLEGANTIAAGALADSIPDDSENLAPNQQAWKRFRENRLAAFSSMYLLALIVLIIFWPLLLATSSHFGKAGARFNAAHSPNLVSEETFQKPSSRHWFGTDVHGRDLMSRVLFGAQISMVVGVVGALVSLVIGVLWGAIAGYLGGRVDSLMMRTVDILYSLPSIIFVIVLITTVEGFFKSRLVAAGSPELARLSRLLFLFIGLGAVSWLTMARIVRGQVLSLRTRPFVEASRVLGGGTLHILRKHIIPNTLGVVIVYLTLTVPAIILYESFLSYLGLGIQPPMASWGSLMSEGVDQMNPIRIYWWLITFPGVFLTTTLLALNFIGDGLRDAWDIRGQNN
jgi:peptide/nickel transport system permease protein/oligopeptide transport system permease protein